jgi:rhodanese-related sulfurtransferase
MNRRRLLLAAAAAALAGGAAFLLPGRGSFAGPTLSAPEAMARATAGTLTLIDIRRPDEWADTGIPAPAKPLDMRSPDFEAKLAELAGGREAPVALICARGVRSMRMAARLQAAGFTNVIDVPEGMLGSSAGPGWQARGLPVVRP